MPTAIVMSTTTHVASHAETSHFGRSRVSIEWTDGGGPGSGALECRTYRPAVQNARVRDSKAKRSEGIRPAFYTMNIARVTYMAMAPIVHATVKYNHHDLVC